MRWMGATLVINGATTAIAALTVIDGYAPSAFALACAAVGVIGIGIAILLRGIGEQ